MLRIVRLITILLVFCAGTATGTVNYRAYYSGSLPDSARLQQRYLVLMDSLWRAHPMLGTRLVVSQVQHPHHEVSHTVDFYLLLALCVVLGLIRFIDERYFFNLWTAFWNPAMATRNVKDHIQDAGFSQFLMNIFFAIVIGTYLFYVVTYYLPESPAGVPSSLLIPVLIGGVGIIYLVKYSAVRFSGWAFRMEAITEHYLFNVFLINKILAVFLLPFVIILAFADRHVADQMIYISFIVAGLLIFNRYLRSWQLFGAFFQNSKFHFFMYLCASELLPVAVLVKFLTKGL